MVSGNVRIFVRLAVADTQPRRRNKGERPSEVFRAMIL
jgi:hypothetical protein